MCQVATNHSLKATAATRLFASGVPENVVSEVTGASLPFVFMNPMQIIYSGRTNASLSHGFCLTQNPKHWSNEEELNPENQKALLIWDIFRGHMTAKVNPS